MENLELCLFVNGLAAVLVRGLQHDFSVQAEVALVARRTTAALGKELRVEGLPGRPGD